MYNKILYKIMNAIKFSPTCAVRAQTVYIELIQNT